MNAAFTAIFIISAALLAVAAPQDFLSALTSGARSSAAAALTLFCVYAVWMGISAVAEKCGATKKCAKLLRPLCFKVFKSGSPEACDAAAMNITSNLLGAGASAPFAVKAIEHFDAEGNEHAKRLLFLINCAGFQLVPATVMALRAGMGSSSAADIFLPSLICSAATLALSVTAFIIAEKIYARMRARVRTGKTCGAKKRSARWRL